MISTAAKNRIKRLFEKKDAHWAAENRIKRLCKKGCPSGGGKDKFDKKFE